MDEIRYKSFKEYLLVNVNFVKAYFNKHQKQILYL
jgi:hypothetical protein